MGDPAEFGWAGPMDKLDAELLAEVDLFTVVHCQLDRTSPAVAFPSGQWLTVALRSFLRTQLAVDAVWLRAGSGTAWCGHSWLDGGIR